MKHLKNNLSERKREQKTILYYHALASMLQQLSVDEPEVSKVFVTKTKLSSDYKICYVYFATYGDKADFKTALDVLKLYKPSMRKALSKEVGGA